MLAQRRHAIPDGKLVHVYKFLEPEMPLVYPLSSRRIAKPAPHEVSCL